MKSFEAKRPRSGRFELDLTEVPHGNILAEHLDPGLPAVALGLNHSLTSAIGNDFEEPHLEYAQELSVLANLSDSLLRYRSDKQEYPKILETRVFEPTAAA